jgi:hypothetical protein
MVIFNRNYMRIAVVADNMCSMPLYILAAIVRWWTELPPTMTIVAVSLFFLIAGNCQF